MTSNLKPGDHVKVEFEGTVVGGDFPYGSQVFVNPDGIRGQRVQLFKSQAKRITPPLPTKIGAVIRCEGAIYVCDGLYWDTPAAVKSAHFFDGLDFEVLSEGVDIP